MEMNGGRVFLAVIASIAVSSAALSCSTAQLVQRTAGRAEEKGVWHRVQKGETIWRIAKTYRISVEELKDVNDLSEADRVAEGSWIFIPGAGKLLSVQVDAEVPEASDGAPEFGWPVKGDIVKTFGKQKKEYNYGIDFRVSRNSAVVATQNGVVVLASSIRGYGNTIIIEHANDFFSLYSKNLRSLVQEGQVVKKGLVIARVQPETGAFNEVLHYELYYRGKPVNPLYYLP